MNKPYHVPYGTKYAKVNEGTFVTPAVMNVDVLVLLFEETQPTRRDWYFDPYRNILNPYTGMVTIPFPSPVKLNDREYYGFSCNPLNLIFIP